MKIVGLVSIGVAATTLLLLLLLPADSRPGCGNDRPGGIAPNALREGGLSGNFADLERTPLAALRNSHKSVVDEIEIFLARLGFTVEEINACTVDTRFGRQHDDSKWCIIILENETWLSWEMELGVPSVFSTGSDYREGRVCRAIEDRSDAITRMREIMEPYFSRDSIDEQFLYHYDVKNTWVLEPLRHAEFGMYYQGPFMVLDASTGCFSSIHFRVRGEFPVCESNIDIETGRRRAEDFAMDIGVWPILSKHEDNRLEELYPGFEKIGIRWWMYEKIPPELLGTERCVYVIRVYGVRDGRWTDLAPVELDVFVDRATGLALYAEYPIRLWYP